MNDIAPIGPSSVAAATQAGRNAPITTPSADSTTTRGGDKVDLSSTAQLISRLANLPTIRQDLVSSVKSQIAAGTYVTPDKIEGAIDNLGQDIQD
jgi:negative regulator of flagellin synthesis FlgM